MTCDNRSGQRRQQIELANFSPQHARKKATFNTHFVWIIAKNLKNLPQIV